MNRLIHLVTAGVIVVGAVTAAVAGNWLAALWAVVALLWCLTSAFTAVRAAEQRKYSRMVESAWIHYDRRGRHAFERFQERQTRSDR